MGIRHEFICECDKCGADISFIDVSEISVFMELHTYGWVVDGDKLFCDVCKESGEQK